LIVWRLCRLAHADLSGDGARLYGGRWNPPGNAVVYTACSAALAVLEVRVNLDLPFDLLPEDYALVEIDLGGLGVETVAAIPEDTKKFGNEWIAKNRTPVLRVPSVIVPEHNFLLNPKHPEAGQARIIGTRPFRFDARLF
jgi:RES domain-containing protein